MIYKNEYMESCFRMFPEECIFKIIFVKLLMEMSFKMHSVSNSLKSFVEVLLNM